MLVAWTHSLESPSLALLILKHTIASLFREFDIVYLGDPLNWQRQSKNLVTWKVPELSVALSRRVVSKSTMNRDEIHATCNENACNSGTEP